MPGPLLLVYFMATTNRVIVPDRRQAGEMDSLESILGLLERLQIQVLYTDY
jgi:hypothetical protein